MDTMKGINTKKIFIKALLLLVSTVEYGESSHLLSPTTATGRYLNIQDRVLQSCRGHFMCEVFPYYSSYGLNCLDINRVCDDTQDCRDGLDELPAVCSGLRRASEGVNGTSVSTDQRTQSSGNKVIQVIRAEPENDSTLDVIVPTMEFNTEGNVQQSNTGQTQEQAQRYDYNVLGINANTSPSIQNVGIANSLTNELPGVDFPTPLNILREQRHRDSNLNRFSPSMQSNNLMGNVFDMPMQNRETVQRPPVANYYNTPQSRIPNNQRDRNTNNMPRRLRELYYGSRNIRRGNRANSGLFGPSFARRFIERQMAVPGSSYVDMPVSTPPPHIPDGFVYQPGQEPYLSQEQQFLEQQFYLTNTLHGPDHQQRQNQIAARTRQGTGQGLSPQEQLANQIRIVQARQEQLMREQFNSGTANVGTTDPSVERYDVMGPFDGGVPSVPGEVKGLNSLEGKEAHDAIHNVEALH